MLTLEAFDGSDFRLSPPFCWCFLQGGNPSHERAEYTYGIMTHPPLTVAARAWLMNVVYLTSVSSKNRKDRILFFSPASVQVHVEEREKPLGTFADL